MSGLDWPQPDPEPLGNIAPTLANSLLACEKKVAFQLDPSTAGLSRPSTRTALGSAAHVLIEAVLKGEAPPAGEREGWLEEKWSEVLDYEAQTLSLAWIGRPVPPTGAWPGLVATRRRLLKRLQTLKVSAPERFEAQGQGQDEADEETPALPWIERWLEDPETGLVGRADLVEEVNGCVRVVDHKTGVHQGEIRETQRRQLLIYAHLVSVRLGVSVSEGVVLDSKGKEKAFRFDPLEVEEVVGEVVSARETFEASRRTRTFTASPTPETCRFCSFRTVCIDYWIARDSHDTLVAWPANDIRGAVIQHQVPNVVSVGEGSGAVLVVLVNGVSLGEATEMVATDLDRHGDHGARMRWDSLIRVDSTDFSAM